MVGSLLPSRIKIKQGKTLIKEEKGKQFFSKCSWQIDKMTNVFSISLAHDFFSLSGRNPCSLSNVIYVQ